MNVLTPIRNAWTQWSKARTVAREKEAIAVLATNSPYAIGQTGRRNQRRVRSAIATLRENNTHLIRNWYEGGFPLLTGDQSWLNQVVQDAKFDQNFVTRREMMRRMRNHAQDVPIHKRGLDISRQYVIGSHMPVVTSVAKSNDPDDNGKTWSQRAEEVWHEMICAAGIDGESLYQMLCVAHDCKKNDGDMGFIKTSRPAIVKMKSGQSVKVMRPCYQMVEAHRIETPFDKFDHDGKDIIDGVQFQIVDIPVDGQPGKTRKVMQRIGYWVKDSIDNAAFTANYTLVPCAAIEFIYSPNRVNQVRGMSDYYAVETTLHLLRDLLKLEMRAQEIQSDLTVFITNGAGQVIDPKMQNTLGALGIKVSKGPDGKPMVSSSDIEKVKSVYQQIWGGRTFVGRTGDTLQHLAPTRPSEATLNLWEFLINSYAVGARVPRCLLFPKGGGGTKSQGTEVRAELDAANSGFISEFNLNWKPLIKNAWVFFMGWAISNDSRVSDPPANWQHIEVSSPRSVLVDVGYDSASTIAEYAEGITNTHFIAQNLGTTEDRLIEMSVRSLAKLKKACERIGKEFAVEIEPKEVRQSLADVEQSEPVPIKNANEEVEA